MKVKIELDWGADDDGQQVEDTTKLVKEILDLGHVIDIEIGGL